MTKPHGYSQLTQEDFEFWDESRQITEPYLENMYPQIEPLLADAETILDIAAGEGHTHRMLSKEVSSRLLSVDLDERALATLQEKYPDAQTAVADANKLPFDDGSFDAAIAINAIGGNNVDAVRGLSEAARVLKPGGRLVFLHDIPSNMLLDRAANKLAELPADVRDVFYILPVLDHATGNVDTLSFVPKHLLAAAFSSNQPSMRMLREKTLPLLDGDWLQHVYDDQLQIATHAKLFARLVKDLQRDYGADDLGAKTIISTHPLVPSTKAVLRKIINSVDGFNGEVLTMEVDTESEEPHFINDREVSSLHVDEMSLPRIVYKTAASKRIGTRISGKSPVFVAHRS